MSNIISGDSNRDIASGVFIWARCGNGHKTAKDAIKEQKIKEYGQTSHMLDVSCDYDVTGEKILNSVWLPFIGRLGDFGVNMWDNAQRKGDIAFLKRYASMSWLAEIVFYPIVYFKMKRLLQNMKMEPKFVVATQAFCLRAIANAILSVNRSKKWNMKLDIHLTDLPSKHAIHFFPSIKRLSSHKLLQNIVQLHAPKPVLKPSQSEKQFWEHHCGRIRIITEQTLPVRQAFLHVEELQKKIENETSLLPIKIGHKEEHRIITECSKPLQYNQTLQEQNDISHIQIPLHKNDKVGLITLGSQPTSQSVINWINSFAEVSIEENIQKSKTDGQQPKHRKIVFVCCGISSKNEKANTLVQEVYEHITMLQNNKAIDPSLVIIPCTNQDADTIAYLMARGNLVVSRSGGATSMELLQLYGSNICTQEKNLSLIHSEAMQYNVPAIKAQQHVSRLLANLYEKLHGKEDPITNTSKRKIKSIVLHYCKKGGYNKKRANNTADFIIKTLLTNKEKSVKQRFEEVKDAIEDIIKEAKKYDERKEKLKVSMMIQKLKLATKYRQGDACYIQSLAEQKILRREGIVLWEGSNAKYLSKTIGAKITNPEMSKKYITERFT